MNCRFRHVEAEEKPSKKVKEEWCRRRCWSLLVQMDPVIRPGEGHRPDMLLDLSGLTRAERVMVQALINNERDVDSVAEAVIVQHPRIHLRESQRRTKGKGKDGSKRGDPSNTRWFRAKKARANTLAAENLCKCQAREFQLG